MASVTGLPQATEAVWPAGIASGVARTDQTTGAAQARWRTKGYRPMCRHRFSAMAGAAEFLTKPVRDQDLLEAILLVIVQDRAHRDDERVVAAVHIRFGMCERSA